MKYKWLLFSLLIILTSNVALGYDNPYGKLYTYEVYYNDEKLDLETKTPVLKIGESFTITFEMTIKQDSFVCVELSDLGDGVGMENFVVVDGPSQIGESCDRVYKENETYTYSWTLKPTDEWAGGSMPVNIYYSILLPGEHETAVNSEFTAVLPYISTEYYDAPETTPLDLPETDTNQTPAFTLPAALLAIALVALRKKC